MRDFDSALLHVGTQLSSVSNRLVRLLEQLTQQLSIDQDKESSNAELFRIAQAALVKALSLQKQAVAQHYVLVRSMTRLLPAQRRRSTSRSTGVAGVARGQRKKALAKVVSGLPTAGDENPNGQLFTGRQREIIELVALGYDNRQIGQSLGIVEQTVKNHLHTIFGKAGVSRRNDLAIHAYEPDRAASGNDFPANQAGPEPLSRTAAGN
jgi:DNA-binding NarL/FixJ family response regulator